MALGFSLLDMSKYQYHKNKESVSVGGLTEDDEMSRLFLILASFDTIENDLGLEIFGKDENGMLGEIKGIAPTLSIKDLVVSRREELNDGRIVTYYKPVACLQILKEEYHYPPSNPYNKRTENENITTDSESSDDEALEKKTISAEVPVTKRRTTIYIVRVLGVSASDIIRYNNNLRDRNFAGTITRPLSMSRVKKALSLLRREQLISPIGRIKGETRYTITDGTVREFIGNCLAIQVQVIELLNKLWKYRIRKVGNSDRRLLEIIYGRRKADQIINDNFAFLDVELPELIEKDLSWRQNLLSSSSNPSLTNDDRKAAIKAEIEKWQREIEQESRGNEKYIRKQIQEMQARYANTFKDTVLHWRESCS